MIVTEVEEAAARQGVNAQRLTGDRVEALRAKVRAVHCSDLVRNIRWLWEAFHDASALQDPNAWKLLASLPIHPLFLWGDQREGDGGWQLDAPADLVRILEDTAGFEFYVSDADATFVVCFNHHDCLIGAGTAKAWVDALPR